MALWQSSCLESSSERPEVWLSNTGLPYMYKDLDFIPNTEKRRNFN